MDPPCYTNPLKAPSRWKGLVPPGGGPCGELVSCFRVMTQTFMSQVKVGMVLPWSLKVGKISRGFVDVWSVKRVF